MCGIKFWKGNENLRSVYKKLFYQLKICLKKSVFWAKLFLGALFTKVICTFLKSVRKDRFLDAPFDLFKEKKFLSLRRDYELF